MPASATRDRIDSLWWVHTYHRGLDCLRTLRQQLERGGAALEMDAVAWENTTAALEWMAGELAAGRMESLETVTGEDVERVRRVRALGRDVLAGAPPSPELLPLVEKCMLALYGPRWELIPDWDTILAAPRYRSAVPRERPALDEASDDLEWVMATHIYGASYLHRFAQAIEHGDADFGIDPSAWENTMAAVEWAMMEHVRGRVRWTREPITREDVERVRRLRALGAAALAGGQRSPELGALAMACLVTLAGADWRGAVENAERVLEAVDQGRPPW